MPPNHIQHMINKYGQIFPEMPRMSTHSKRNLYYYMDVAEGYFEHVDNS